MNLDYKKILKILATGVGAVAAVKVLQQVIAGLLLDAKIKEKVEAGKKRAADAKKSFVVTDYLQGDDLSKWAQAQTNGLVAASAVIIVLAQKFLKNADMKIAAWAGAGFPVALGLSALVDKTGKIAESLEFQIVRAPDTKAGASGGTMQGPSRISIPAASLVDFIQARGQAQQTVQGRVHRIAEHVVNGDVHEIAAQIVNGDDSVDDYIADFVEEAAA